MEKQVLTIDGVSAVVAFSVIYDLIYAFIYIDRYRPSLAFGSFFIGISLSIFWSNFGTPPDASGSVHNVFSMMALIVLVASVIVLSVGIYSLRFISFRLWRNHGTTTTRLLLFYKVSPLALLLINGYLLITTISNNQASG
jgi:hypothetical protein